MTLHALLFLLLLLVPDIARATPPDQPPLAPSTVEQAQGRPEPPRGAGGAERPQTTTLGLRRVSGVLALVPAVMLTALYFFRPQMYIRAWIALWLCIAGPLLLFSIGANVLNLDNPEGRTLRLAIGRFVVGAGAFTWLGGMTMLALSARWVRGAASWPRWLKPVATFTALWCLLGAVVFGLGAIAVPGWIVGMMLFVFAAIRFLELARRQRFVGALVIGLCLLTVPINALMQGAFRMAGMPLPDNFGVWTMVYALLALGMFLLVFEDVTYELRQKNTALARAQAELEAKAVTDPLTGCYNRRFFDDLAPRELARHKRHRLPLALLFFDCDRFKRINDLLGHDIGDRVLETIGRLLRSHLRATDYVIRWGGDEFLALVTCDEQQAETKAMEISNAFDADPMLRRLPEGTGLSAGWAMVPPDAKELLPYVEIADQRMFAMKRLPA